jgi:23S rRNA pseudouridine1911/1915/1917 synthase
VPVTSPKEGERLDRYLVRLGLAASRRASRELIARGMVSVNGHRYRKGALVSPGDRVEVAPEPFGAALEPDLEITLEVLFEDAAVVVVNKPGLLPCHPVRPGGRGTVMNAMAALFPETASAGDKPIEGGLVHRLDNGTSGALMVARTNETFARLREDIRAGHIARRYVALVAGRLTGRLELSEAIAHHPRSPRRMVAVSAADASSRLKARPAESAVEPLEHIGPYTLVSVVPRTGMRHQIRVHLANAGYPIVGDELYGGPPHPSLPTGRFWLHLEEIRFDSPASGRVTVKAPLPPELRESARLPGSR